MLQRGRLLGLTGRASDSLFNPLQTTVATVHFVGTVLVQTRLHSCLSGGLTRVLGRYRVGKYRVAGCSWCGRGRRLGRCRFRRLRSWSRGCCRRRRCGCCIRSALRLAEIVPLHATERACFLGSIVLCTALLHRKCVGRIALKSDGDDKCTSRYCNLTEDHGSGSLNYPHPRTHQFDVLLGPREWTLPYLTVRNCCLRGDAIPMTINHLGKLLIGLEPLPLEACPPVLEEAPRPALAFVAP